MFTGIVQRVGVWERLAQTAGGGWSATIGQAVWPETLEIGESVAVQGTCLTVTAVTANGFTADILDETLGRTALGHLVCGAKVNLERALTLADHVGGHLVSGHVDETGRLVSVTPRGRDVVWRLGCSRGLAGETVMKGSITIDGVSLTVSGLGEDWLEVNLIPHTLASTSLCARQVGEVVNLEADILGKYVAKFLARAGIGRMASGVTEEKLKENGFI